MICIVWLYCGLQSCMVLQPFFGVFKSLWRLYMVYMWILLFESGLFGTHSFLLSEVFLSIVEDLVLFTIFK